MPPADGDLDAFYRGRRWLTEWLNDPAHQVTFRLEPGDVMFMDNIRVLHGRTEFDASNGVRHLQGAYIDHDGPDTMYRLTVRRRRTAPAASSARWVPLHPHALVRNPFRSRDNGCAIPAFFRTGSCGRGAGGVS